MNILPISLVVPFYNEELCIESFWGSIKSLSSLPSQVVFVDAGSNDSSLEVIKKVTEDESDIEVTIVLHEDDKVRFPGKSRNLGIKESKYEWIAFLDVGLFPDQDWLEKQWGFVTANKYKGSLGNCIFSGDSIFQKSVCALTSGLNSSAVTLPGSLIHKNVFQEVGSIPENLRAAEDLVWKKLFIAKYGNVFCEDALIRYHSFPTDFLAVIKKWFLYSRYNVRADVTKLQSIIFPLFLLVLLACLIISIDLFLIIFFVHLFLRGVLDPMRRSKNKFWWKGTPISFLLAMIIAPLIDYSKGLGFASEFLRRTFDK